MRKSGIYSNRITLILNMIYKLLTRFFNWESFELIKDIWKLVRIL